MSPQQYNLKELEKELEKESDFDFDTYIKMRVKTFDQNRCRLEPSACFCSKTMAKISKVERKKRVISDCLFLIFALTPFIIRQSWLLVRNDYFSISNLPMANVIGSIYNFYLSPLGMYSFLLVGIVGMSLYLFKTYHWSFTTIFKGILSTIIRPQRVR